MRNIFSFPTRSSLRKTCYWMDKPIRSVFKSTLGVGFRSRREALSTFSCNCREYHTPPQGPQSPKGGSTCRVDDLLAGMHNAARPGKQHVSQRRKPGVSRGEAGSSFTFVYPTQTHVEELLKTEKEEGEGLERDQDTPNRTDCFSKRVRPQNSELWMRHVESAEREVAFYRTTENEASPFTATNSVPSRDEGGGGSVPEDPNSASLLSQYEAHEADNVVGSDSTLPNYTYTDDEIEFGGAEESLLGLDDDQSIPEHLSEVLESEEHTRNDERVDLFGGVSTLPSASLAFSDDDTDEYEDENGLKSCDTDSEEYLNVSAGTEEEILNRFFEQQRPTPSPPLPPNEGHNASAEALDRMFEEDASVSEDEFRFFKANQRDLEAVASSFSLNFPQQSSEGSLPVLEAFDEVVAQLAEVRSVGDGLPSPAR